jgi:multidrug efflux pump subunit AcrA (membrane-fusion protein)
MDGAPYRLRSGTGSIARNRKVIAVAALLVACAVALSLWLHHSSKPPTAPTFEVKREEFLDVLQFRGELKSMKSVTITAPADAGDLQILKLAADGTHVNAGDVVAEFDPSKTQHDLAQDQSILKSAQAEIDQVRAQGRLTEEQDTTAVTKAKYDVEVAKLDASKSEIVSKIEGAEANLKLSDAEQALHEAEEKLKSDRAVNLATIESKKQASAKAAYDAQRAEHSLAAMTLKAPASGTISLTPLWHNGGESSFKPGEQAWPGAPLAELPDATSLRIAARVDETERGRLALALPATLQLDAIADRQFTGKIARIGTIASSDFSAGWPIPRNFDLEIAIDQADQRLKPGMTVQVTVIVDRIPNSITIPAQASFLKSGQTVAYVWDGAKFQARFIQIERRSRDRVLVSRGLNAGDKVALKDPTEKE